MDSSGAAIPVTQQELAGFLERAGRLLVSVKWTPKPFAETAQPAAGALAWRESTTTSPQQEELNLLQQCRVLVQDPVLLPPGCNQAFRALRQGLCVGMHLSKIYTKFSSLDQLVNLNAKGGLAEPQKVEFRGKYQTASAIAVFGAAYYLLWELSSYRPDELRGINLELPPPPEVFLQDPVRALDCFVFYLAAVLRSAPGIKDDLTIVKAFLVYAEAVVEELQRRKDSFSYAEPFTGAAYQLEGTEFRVHGFSAEIATQYARVEFNRVRLEEIVGNQEAKHLARRIASRLLCYDPVTKKNPMFDLGGLPTVTLGFGEPGTGKSLLIAALATLLDEQCEALGIPFLFWPMPDTIVSTFQGGSAERMVSWMSALKDPTKIIYAPIDDAENNLEERSRQGVSSGVREVIAVFLRNTEGAYAVNRGNAVIQLFTNLPEQIDKAALSRIQQRAVIAGAVSDRDFLDQDYLWYRKYLKIDQRFVNMEPPRDYELLSAQVLLKNLSQVSGALREPSHPRVRAIFERVSARVKPAAQAFFAELYVEIKKEFPLFTSRDVRNIQKAVDARILDFDFPESWFSDPALFFKNDYATKHAMLVQTMRDNLGSLSFADVRLQETVKYLDAMAAIQGADFERRVGSLVDEYRVQAEARARLAATAK